MTDRPIGSDYRLPAMPQSRDGKLVDKNTLRADVPCGKCTLCCRTLIVPLAEEEYQRYDGYWAWICKPDGTHLSENSRALQRKPNGECIFLGESGCTIHGHAPHVCQSFDCRELFRKSDRNGRRQAIASGKLPKELFEKGREMLKLRGGE